MAAARSSVARKRNLSLDLVAATKENEERIRVWSALSNNTKNGTPPISNVNKNSSKQEHFSFHLYTRKKEKRDKSAKKEAIKAVLQTQSSEMRRKWFQKMLSWRYCMVLLLQSAFVVGMFLRNCLPMAMVCMVKPRSMHSSHIHESKGASNRTSNESGSDGITPAPTFHNISFSRNDTHDKTAHYEFDWSPEVQGLVLTSIMFSTFIGPLVIAAIKGRVGIKWAMSLMNLAGALLTFLSPTAARLSPYCLIVVRLLLGVSMGGTVTVVGDSIAWWAPQDEKLTMVALSFTGVNIGTVLASLLSGYLCLMPWDNGWPFVFYTFGALSLIWGVCWHFLSSLKPEEHRYISEKEKQYIISHRIGMDSLSGKNVKPPYCKLISSIPVLTYFAVGTCHVWVTMVLFTYLPTFFYKQMKFTVQETGLLTSLTNLFRMLGSFWWTILGNKTVSALGTNKSRKLCICIGFVLASSCTLTVGFFDDSYRWVVLGLLIFVMINQSVGSSTITALPLDMAPRYAGLLAGMLSSLGSLFAISGPLLTSAITANETHEEWQRVWIIASSIYLTGAIIFVLFGNASMQPWAHGKETEIPNIVSPFVTMGRRFSTFIEAPPLSPISPREKRFDFSNQLQSNPEHIIAHVAYSSPEILHVGIDLGNTRNLTETVTFSGEVDDSSSDSDDTSMNYGYNDDESTNEQTKPVRMRAFSEFGLEVLRSKITLENNTEDSDRDESSFSEKLKTRQENDTGFVKEQSDQIKMTGIVNKSFEDSEDKTDTHSDNVEISHL